MDSKYSVQAYSNQHDSEDSYDFAYSETRYRIVDTETGEILDDAQGYGYKTAQKAHTAWNFKKNGGYPHSVFDAGKWLEQNKDVLHELSDICEINFKNPEFKGVSLTVFEEIIAGQEVAFTAKDLKKAWDKGLYLRKEREKSSPRRKKRKRSRRK